MTLLDKYLKTHYLITDAFASYCGISTKDLNALIERELIPEPSYVVTADGKVISYVFGEIDSPGSIPGRYFHPKGHTWVSTALQTPDAKTLQDRFRDNFALALAEQNKATWRLRDAFTDSGEPIEAGLSSRTESAWVHFLNGTYCLCVADPSSEKSIVHKEILQEKLTAITNNGANAFPDGISRSELLNLIENYASASMPFSPVEYELSSRKRLVEDLRNIFDQSITIFSLRKK